MPDLAGHGVSAQTQTTDTGVYLDLGPDRNTLVIEFGLTKMRDDLSAYLGL